MELRYRTEDLTKEDIKKFFVESSSDRGIIEALKAINPVIIEGSRGTGKSFLLKTAELEMNQQFGESKVIPIYISFVKGSLVNISDINQFHYWMLAKICSHINRALKRYGISSAPLVDLISGEKENSERTLDQLIRQFENSWQQRLNLDLKILPTIDELKQTIEEICDENNLKRICLLFDEVAHIFRPEQQRAFFSIFRDLRSPYITCNAAVYPGVTSYGETFQKSHDATIMQVNRDVLDKNYLENMREIVIKQGGQKLSTAVERNANNFAVLSYAVSGNPRLLLKTIAKCPNLTSKEIDPTIKEFYRSDIWAEHTQLSEVYKGHRQLIDWGRDFIEKTVLPDTQQKNDQRLTSGKNESTCYFWIHKDAAEPVKAGIRLLCYTGIAQEMDQGIRGTRSEVGARYSINLGCLFALEANPSKTSLQIVQNLSIKRFSEYGINHQAFSEISSIKVEVINEETKQIFKQQLSKPISSLDLTEWQMEALTKINLKTIGDLLAIDESVLMEKIDYVGPTRAKKIMTAANAAMLEYLSG